jgi:hypothetical protein
MHTRNKRNFIFHKAWKPFIESKLKTSKKTYFCFYFNTPVGLIQPNKLHLHLHPNNPIESTLQTKYPSLYRPRLRLMLLLLAVFSIQIHLYQPPVQSTETETTH